MTNLTDSQIDNLADECICDYCKSNIVDLLSKDVFRSIKEELEQPPQPHKELFDALFKALDPHEKKFVAMLNTIWEEEQRIVVANIKKLKKAYRGKDAEDTVNQLLFPQKEMAGKVANNTKPLLVNVVDESGKREMAKLEVNAVFDVANPEVQKWLKEYVPVFSKNLEAVSADKLRRELIAGLEKGESIPELIKRVNNTYLNWNKVRSRAIARSEVIRASNAGAKFSYIQSGVVKKLQWLSFIDKRTCAWCLDLNGKIVGIEENFFDKGDTFTISGDGKKQTMKLDYTDTPHPPLHTLCRCSVIPIVGSN